MTLGKLRSLAKLQFFHLWKQDKNSVYLIGLLWVLNEIMYVKHIAQNLPNIFDVLAAVADIDMYKRYVDFA